MMTVPKDADYIADLEDRIRRLESRGLGLGSEPAFCARRFSTDKTIFDISPTFIDITDAFLLDEEVVNIGGFSWEAGTKKLHVPTDGVYRFGMYGRYRLSINGGAGDHNNLLIWNVYSSQQTAEQFARVVVADGVQVSEIDGGFLNIISPPVALNFNDWIKGATSSPNSSGAAGIDHIDVYGGSGDEQLTMWIEKLSA